MLKVSKIRLNGVPSRQRGPSRGPLGDNEGDRRVRKGDLEDKGGGQGLKGAMRLARDRDDAMRAATVMYRPGHRAWLKSSRTR